MYCIVVVVCQHLTVKGVDNGGTMVLVTAESWALCFHLCPITEGVKCFALLVSYMHLLKKIFKFSLFLVWPLLDLTAVWYVSRQKESTEYPVSQRS